MQHLSKSSPQIRYCNSSYLLFFRSCLSKLSLFRDSTGKLQLCILPPQHCNTDQHLCTIKLSTSKSSRKQCVGCLPLVRIDLVQLSDFVYFPVTISFPWLSSPLELGRWNVSNSLPYLHSFMGLLVGLFRQMLVCKEFLHGLMRALGFFSGFLLI